MRGMFGGLLVLLAVGVSAEPLELPGDAGTIAVTTSVAGDDLSIVAQFEQPVKSLLSADNPIFSLDLYFDTDNKVETGYSQVQDARRGADYSVMVILRAQVKDGPRGEPEEVLVAKMAGEVGTTVKTNTRLLIDGNRIQVLIPMSAMGLRAGRTIRVAGFSGPNDPLDQTITLQSAEPASKMKKRE